MDDMTPEPTDAPAAPPDELNRLWGHGMHEEKLFHDRLNYFTAMQVGLLGVFAILYNKDPALGVFLPLTAVALVFAIFKLNPAPFCLLDEVDAPLDDANVGRFSEIVREMSDQVQFVLITHNKTTMEAMNQLAGVTMHEPGVSRLVSVDIDEAVQLAAM